MFLFKGCMWIKNGHWLLIYIRPLYPLWDCTHIESDPSKLDPTGTGTKCPKVSAVITGVGLEAEESRKNNEELQRATLNPD